MSDITPKLHGISIGKFRGIGDIPQRICGFRKMNFFIGQNNAGKSTVLLALARLMRITAGGLAFEDPQVESFDLHQGSSGTPIFGIGLRLADVLESFEQGHPFTPLLTLMARKCSVDEHVWLEGAARHSAELSIAIPQPEALYIEGYNERTFYDLALQLTSSAGNIHSNLDRIYAYISRRIPLAHPRVRLIPAFRRPESDGQNFDDGNLSGRGIISRLAELQNPSDVEKYDIEAAKFRGINDFIRDLTGDSTAHIEIPADRSTVLVYLNNRRLPLANLGTGIHQAILIAAFCTIFQGDIMCVEEPELHLHPSLQRKLVRYLQKNTQNQYFIATHSASFIDTEGAAIFHTYLDGNTTQITSAMLDNDRFRICQDLGIRASDIVQSNFVIWVEGPSERLYINHWISDFAPNLIENVHYSIMFYGGRLLKHLSAQDDEVSDFIKLRSLNRNLAIVMDSDRSKAGEAINSTKRRIRTEIEDFGGVVWVTKGREIENYVNFDDIQKAISEIHPQIYGSPGPEGDYAHAFHFYRKARPGERKAIEAGADKVKIAHKICHRPANLDVLDLRSQVGALVRAIEKANDLDPQVLH